MKLFVQEIVMDIKHGVLYKYYKYFFALFLGSIFSIFFVVQCINSFKRGNIESLQFTVGDIILFLFKGKKTYNSMDGIEFMPPTEYMMLQFCILYMIGDYIIKDLLGVGKNIIVRTQKRKYWWFSKCIWCIVTVLCFYAAIYISAVTLCIIMGGKLTMSLTPDIAYTICEIPQMVNEVPVDLQVLKNTVCVLPIVTSVGIALFQMTLALIVSPVISYIVNVILIIFAVYYTVPFLQGNSFMMLRNECCIENGVDTSLSIIITAVVCVISIIAGKIYFEKMDILKREH